MTPILVHAACWVAYMGLEYWLGKTEKVKAGSFLQLAAQVALHVLKKAS